MVVNNINCGGLYTGGGGNSVPLPYALPDMSSAVSAITACEGQNAMVGAATVRRDGQHQELHVDRLLLRRAAAGAEPG
jgi:hypothetical protein